MSNYPSFSERQVEELEQKLLSLADWPTKVEDLHLEKGEDASGHEAFWAWVTLNHPMEDSDLRSRIRDFLRQKLAIYARPESNWVYVRFRGEQEPAVE